MSNENSKKKWADGLRFVQAKKNRSYHCGIKQSPYEAMFGLPQRIGLKDSDLPQEILETLSTEEELKNVIKHVQNESYVTDKGFLNQNTVHQGNQNRIYNMEVDMELLGTENLENETMRVEESVEIVVDESTSTKDLFLLKNFVAVPTT
jgi:hypothetical protein